MFLTWLIISTLLYQVNGACDNLLNSNTYVVVNSMGKNYTFYDCKLLVKQLRMACKYQKPDVPAIGGPDGLCCKKCPNNLTCFDQLSKLYFTKVTFNLLGTNKDITKNLKTCSLLVNKYPALCRDPQYRDLQGICCKACQAIDPNAECYDRLVAFKSGKKKLVCKDYVKKDKCRCANPQVKNLCCKSCETEDPRARNCCTNLLSTWNAIIVPYNGKNNTLTSCSKLSSHPYTVLCRDEDYGGIAGQCCKSCSSKNLTCLDNLGPFSYDNQMFAICKKLIEYNPCLCNNPAWNQVCCRSCEKNTDRTGCDCQDAASLNVTMPDGSVLTTSCSAYVASDVCNCLDVGQICCASCQGLDTSQCNCRDSPGLTLPNNVTTDCSTWVNADPCRCLEANTQTLCCRTCNTTDVSNCDCTDSPSLQLPNNGGTTTCSAWVSADPCRCLENSTNTLCCSTCETADKTGCNCTDLDVVASSVLPGETCSSLVMKHPCLCMNMNFSIGCCRSCEDAAPLPDCSCYDSIGVQVGGNVVNCSYYVEQDPCRCVDVGNLDTICCDACSKANVSGCGCNDDDDFASSIVANETCASLVTANRCWCWNSNFSAGCCDSCSDMLHMTMNCTCYDSFPFIPSGMSSSVLCSDYVPSNVCNCVDNPSLASHCCASCDAADTTPCNCRDATSINFNGQSMNCSTFAMDPCNCLIANASTICCDSCQIADTSNCSCRDSNIITYNGMTTTCADFTQNPCNCELENATRICCESCRNADLSGCNCTDVDPLIILLDPPVTTSCAAYVNEDKCRCYRQQSARENCCATCEAQGNLTALCSCVDTLSFKVNNVTTNCAAQIAIDECRCLQLGSTCCASCSGRNLTYCQCRDTLSTSNPIVFPPGSFCTLDPIDNCGKLVSDYSDLCNTFGANGNGICCDSCSSVNLSCVDGVYCFGRLSNTKLYKSCKELTDAHICECDSANIKTNCCASCNGFDPVASGCNCTDGLGWNYMNYTSPLQSSNVYTDCTTLKNTEPTLCTTSNFVKNTLCCRTCL